MCMHGCCNVALHTETTSYGFVQSRSFRHTDQYHEEVEDLEVRSQWAPPRRVETRTLRFLLCGDQNAGKTTFLHSFADDTARPFLALHSYLPSLGAALLNSRLVEHSPSDEGPFLDTDVASSSILLSSSSFLFFCMEAGLSTDEEHWGLKPGVTEFVNVQFIELGGDHLDRMIVDAGVDYSVDYLALQPPLEHRVLHLQEKIPKGELSNVVVDASTFQNTSSIVEALAPQQQIEFRLEQLQVRTNALLQTIPSMVYTINLKTLGTVTASHLIDIDCKQWKLMQYRIDFLLTHSQTAAQNICLNRGNPSTTVESIVEFLCSHSSADKNQVEQYFSHHQYVYQEKEVSILDIVRNQLPLTCLSIKPAPESQDEELATPMRCTQCVSVSNNAYIWDGVVPLSTLTYFSIGDFILLDLFLQLYFAYRLLMNCNAQITTLSCYNVNLLDHEGELNVTHTLFHTKQLFASYSAEQSFKLIDARVSTLGSVAAFLLQDLFEYREFDVEAHELSLFSGELDFVDKLETDLQSVPARAFLVHYARTCHMLQRGGLVQIAQYGQSADIMCSLTEDSHTTLYTPQKQVYTESTLETCIEYHRLVHQIRDLFFDLEDDSSLLHRYVTGETVTGQLQWLEQYIPGNSNQKSFLTHPSTQSLFSNYLLHPCVRLCYLPHMSTLQYSLLADGPLDPLYFHISEYSITLPTMSQCSSHIHDNNLLIDSSLFANTYQRMFSSLSISLNNPISLLQLEDLCLLHNSLEVLPQTITQSTSTTLSSIGKYRELHKNP